MSDAGARRPGSALAGAAAAGVERLAALAIALWLPRHLGLADYGRYTLVLAFLGLFQALPDQSLETAVVARIAAAGGAQAPAIAGGAALLRLGVSLAAALAGLAALFAVSGDVTVVAAGTCWAAGLAIVAANPYRALLRGVLRLDAYLLVAIAQAVATVTALVVVIATGGGLAGVLATGPAGALAATLVGRRLAGRGAVPRPDRALARDLLRVAWPLAGTTLVIVGAQQALQGLLARTHGPEALGLLGGAQRLVDAVNLLPQALAVSLLPALARADGAGVRARGRDGARALGVVVAPAVTALAVWPALPLGWLLGGGFVVAAPILRAAAPLALLVASGTVLTAQLVAVGAQRLLLVATAISAAVTLGLGAWLVPAHGPLGVALAQVCGMLSGQLVLAAVPATRPFAGGVLGAVLRPLVLAVGAALLAREVVASEPVAAAVAGATYVLLVLATGTVRAQDLARWRR